MVVCCHNGAKQHNKIADYDRIDGEDQSICYGGERKQIQEWENDEH